MKITAFAVTATAVVALAAVCSGAGDKCAASAQPPCCAGGKDAAAKGDATVVLASNPGAPDLTPAKRVTIEDIKKLAGEWVMVGEDGKPTDEVVSNYRVTAGGSAVLEILFPGTEKEMVTVYHQDGDQLLLTHYCMLGNQPRMRAVESDKPGQLVFRCDGKGTNMKEDDQHMHEGVLTFVSADRYTSQWHMTDKGEVTYTASFDVVRRKAKSAKKVAGTAR